jgi:predicted RNase H-like nuclease
LTEANKAIKHKEILLKQHELKVIELEKYVKQIKGLGQEQAVADSAQNPGIFDDNLMTKLKQATQAAENARVKSNPENL